MDAVVALMIVGVIVFTSIFQINFFLTQEKRLTEKLLLYRKLNEEITIYSRYQDVPLSYSKDGYLFTFQEREGVIVRGAVEKDGEQVIIERE